MRFLGLRLYSRSLATSISLPKIPLPDVHPSPVRKEFLSDRRLTTHDLESFDIGLHHHQKPLNAGDYLALGVVKSLRIPADLFFRKKYLHRAVSTFNGVF